MAKISDTAKQIIINDLNRIYPEGKLIDKKYYVNLLVEGEIVQICISLTAPKTPIDLGNPIADKPAAVASIDSNQIEKEVDDIFDFFKL